MAERLGNVLYWLGCGLAVAAAGLTVLVAFEFDVRDRFFVLTLALGLIVAIGIWLFGVAFKYVLSGRS